MEREKRKRSEKDSEEAMKKKAREEEAIEKEVEEFFAILRRMQVAVQYFGKENGEGWRTAVEAEVAVAVVEANKEEGLKTKEKVERSGVLDLNVTPEAETNGDV